MRRVTACFAVGAMLLALLYAPLFHVHDHDDYGNPDSFVHAHFPELASPWRHDGSDLETQHSDDHARGIDVFTVNTPAAVFHAGAEVYETLSVPSFEGRDSIVFLGLPRAHSPPDTRRSAPRSPPAL